jgi:ELP3 family radical SAM enzyme/protein acetyltransferase
MNIEDLVINDENDTIIDFVTDFASLEYSSRDEYTKEFTELRKKYKINPRKTLILKTYRELVNEGVIEPNPSFYKFSIKKIGKSSSGVSVITVLTSPDPEYTNYEGEKVKQSFSCGNSCSYCPNEPEERFDLIVIDKNEEEGLIKVKTTDDLRTTRVLSYVLDPDFIERNVIECSHFKGDNFIIKMDKDDLVNGGLPGIDQKIIGVKRAQPRSYLSSEPAVLRANRNNFSAIEQFNDRADALTMCGHPVDKIEIIILGGTWDHYPKEYQYEFIRDIYYASNVYSQGEKRRRESLEQEILDNETAGTRIIGVTIETRPDCINLRSIQALRELNVTRVQLGVQHIDDDILKIIKRNCYVKDTIKATNLLKNNGYKVDWHLMPDLPGSSFEKDFQMINDIFGVKNYSKHTHNHSKYQLEHPELQPDQLKIYPCTTVDWTEIKDWYEEGYYKPYSDNEEVLKDLIVHIKRSVFPWIRLNRIVRDIPNMYILGGNENINLRQHVLKEMKEKGLKCDCIRCAEVKDKNFQIEEAELFIDEYDGLDSTEYFISYRSSDKKILYGFLRLRINYTNDNLVYEELNDSGLVRELHVYGQLIKHNDEGSTNSVQHQGLGKKLLKKAEEICLQNDIHKVSIISGVGVRDYYRKNGYRLENHYMVKDLQKDYYYDYTELFLKICIIIVFISIILTK